NAGPLLGPDAENMGAVMALHDITDRQQAEERERQLLQEQTARKEAEAGRRRFAFLAEISSRLAASLDYRTTLEQVAELLLPRFADWCVVDLLEPRDDEAVPGLQTVVVEHADPEKHRTASEIRRLYPPSPATQLGVWDVVRSGRSQLVSTVTEETRAALASDPAHRTLINELGVRSFMRVPLAARGRILGVLSMGSPEPGRYTADDLALAEEIGRRAALAVDNARLYRDARRAEEELRSVTAHAHCILFYADIAETEEGFVWHTHVSDEHAAQQVLPLDVRPGMTYQNAWMRSRYPEDVARMEQTATTALRTGTSSYSQEFRCRDCFGEERWLFEDVRLEPREPGRWRAVGVCTDITARKQMEAELRRQAELLREADRRKDEFLAMLAHELRNPLGAISNAVHVLEQAGASEAACRRAVEVMRRQLRHQ
ncbi:MAG TPA: GAF domain-containing protein, partial [Armatimonadota bacterium]|nr:GAF domain-containing protein [Armatimonadota bacterium]